MSGFTDYHAHFVYGVDDGAQTREEMYAMLDAAAADGVRHLFATSHSTPGMERFPQEVYDRHLALARAYCTQKGYDLKLEDPRLIPEILALIDGGTLATTGESDAKKTTYSAPAAGKPVTRKKFDFYLYTSDRDTDADVIKYNEWKFPKCKGAPISGSMTQGDFSKMEYNLKSRPAMGESPLTIAEVDALPEPTA